jgi:hypothetical protein
MPDKGEAFSCPVFAARVRGDLAHTTGSELSGNEVLPSPSHGLPGAQMLR